MLIGLSGTGPQWIALSPPPPLPPFEQLAPGVKTGMDFRGQGPVVRKAVNAFHWINLYPVDRAIHPLSVRFHVYFQVTFDDLCCKQTPKVRTSVSFPLDSIKCQYVIYPLDCV